MSTHSGSIWTVRCASSSTSPSCGQSHGPIASSIPLRAAALLLGGNASDPEAQSLGACPSRGKFTSRITRHGQSDDPRANVSSVGPCTEDHSDQLLASVEAACDPCDRDRVTDMITRKGQIKLVGASPALSQTSMQTCVHVSNSGRRNSMRKHQRAHLHRRLSGKSRPTRATGPVSGNNLHNLLARRPIKGVVHYSITIDHRSLIIGRHRIQIHRDRCCFQAPWRTLHLMEAGSLQVQLHWRDVPLPVRQAGA